MAGLVSSIIGGATALGGAIWGSAKSAKYNRKYRRLIQNQRDKNEDWNNIRQSEDLTLRADVQAENKRIRDLFLEGLDRDRARNTVAGGTDESLALQKEGMNRSVAQMGADIAAQTSAMKDSYDQQYRAQDAALNQQQAQSYQQQAQQTAQAASQVVNAGINMVGNGLASKGMTLGGDTGSTFKPQEYSQQLDLSGINQFNGGPVKIIK